uniref:Uncharacterized protein n=1 Tax=Oryza sativa subsp. japonica TaxID=39947 RepID=Q69TV1_ORYSJ|nr:hypothetical protein [Oryza sativa Japonica Group]BAD35726.1 hypothetical protein [Oryza sativa Japonica Group]
MDTDKLGEAAAGAKRRRRGIRRRQRSAVISGETIFTRKRGWAGRSAESGTAARQSGGPLGGGRGGGEAAACSAGQRLCFFSFSFF